MWIFHGKILKIRSFSGKSGVTWILFFSLDFPVLPWIFHDFLGFSQSSLGFSDLILDSRDGPSDRRRSKKFKPIQNHQIIFVFRRNNFFLYLHHIHVPNQTKKQMEVQKGTRGIFLTLRCPLNRGCFYFCTPTRCVAGGSRLKLRGNT